MRESTSVPCHYAFVKYVHLQLLTDRVRKLELEALRFIQDVKIIVDVSLVRWSHLRSGQQVVGGTGLY